jgi:hypothetical protein
LLEECANIKKELHDLDDFDRVESAVEKFRSLISKYDLENRNNFWTVLKQHFFWLSNKVIMDQIVSYERILAEAALRKGDLGRAEEVQKRVLKTYDDQKIKVKQAHQKALLNLLKEKFRKKKDRQPQSTNQDVPPRCEGHEIPSRPQGQMPKMEKSDYQLLTENLKANMQFFRLGRVKMKHFIRV